MILILTIAFATPSKFYGQSATIKIEKIEFDGEQNNIDSILFNFNGTKFWGRDTIPKKIKLHKNLDKCSAIIGNDTLNFLAKFKAGQIYVLRPGCCCTAFTLQALQNPNRGTVSLVNKTRKELGLTVCEHNMDTAKVDSAVTTYAHESAMCFFKPCKIQIVETSFFSDEYEYKNDNRNYFRLWIEREALVLNQIWFLFLHGEKVEIKFDNKTQKIRIKTIGYHTKEELEKFMK